MKQKEVYILIISSFVLVLIWIGLSIYHSFADSTVSEILKTKTEPIDPTFDVQTISQLKLRKVITPNYTIAESASDENATTSGSQLSEAP